MGPCKNTDMTRSAFFALALISAWPSTAIARPHTAIARSHDDAGVNALYDRLSEAVVNSDAAKVASIYRPDSIYLGPGISPIVGRDAITSAFTGSWKAARGQGATVDLRFRLLQRIWHGPNVVTDIGFSKFSFIYNDKTKAPKIAYDKFVTVALRQKDGSWAFRVDTNNSQPAKTGAAEFDALKPVADLKYDR